MDWNQYSVRDSKILDSGFDIYKITKQRDCILDEDLYNLDKKIFMIEVAGNAKVIFLSKQKQIYIRQSDI